jgi:hypothetical protein
MPPCLTCKQYVQFALTFLLLRLNMLELLRLMHKVICICLRCKPPFIWLLNKIFISLFLCESDRVLFCLEVKMCPLHAVRRRLPAYERVLPPMALLQYVPVHPPRVAVPVTGLGCGFGRTVYPGDFVSWCRMVACGCGARRTGLVVLVNQLARQRV